MTSYEKGQIDLINDIKSKVDELVKVTSVKDLPFDLINLLRNIKPIQK